MCKLISVDAKPARRVRIQHREALLPPQMPAEAPTIRRLPESVALRLRSTLAVTTLSDAISQLVQNSLDAEARNIKIQANLSRNSCVVEDDGVGILPVDVNMVGKMYGLSLPTEFAGACG